MIHQSDVEDDDEDDCYEGEEEEKMVGAAGLGRGYPCGCGSLAPQICYRA